MVVVDAQEFEKDAVVADVVVPIYFSRQMSGFFALLVICKDVFTVPLAVENGWDKGGGRGRSRVRERGSVRLFLSLLGSIRLSHEWSDSFQEEHPFTNLESRRVSRYGSDFAPYYSLRTIDLVTRVVRPLDWYPCMEVSCGIFTEKFNLPKR